MPAMLLLFLGLFRILPYLSPKNFEIETFHFTYLYIMVVTTGLFAYLHAVMLFAIWQNVAGAARPMDIGRVLTGGIFLFFALLGNVMGKIKRNFYIGVRTPWGLTSIGTETYAKPRQRSGRHPHRDDATVASHPGRFHRPARTSSAPGH